MRNKTAQNNNAIEKDSLCKDNSIDTILNEGTNKKVLVKKVKAKEFLDTLLDIINDYSNKTNNVA